MKKCNLDCLMINHSVESILLYSVILIRKEKKYGYGVDESSFVCRDLGNNVHQEANARSDHVSVTMISDHLQNL